MKRKLEHREYMRDGRAPVPANEVVSRVMSANRGKDTGPEKILAKALWAAGIRGYRKNWKKAPGRPDIAFPGRKIAIFIHGCFWHRCPRCRLPLPKSNQDFWKEKFARNKKRDTQKLKELDDLGWQTIVVYECELESGLIKIVGTIKKKFFKK